MKNTHILCTAAMATFAIWPVAQGQETGRQLTAFGDPIENPDGTQILEGNFIKWDNRCAGNIAVTVNSGFLPNAGNASATNAPFSEAETEASFRTALSQWNENPSSFVNMEVDDLRKFLRLEDRTNGFLDFTNEASFEEGATAAVGAGGALGVSASIALMEDTVFEPGDDIDGDGDADVFDVSRQRIPQCTDIDDDGDIDYPSGEYPAGTILENDVLFSSLVDWEREPTTTGADLIAVITHEYGHSHGLTHSVLRSVSPTDATAATMFPFLPAGDPVSEAAIRSLHPDDISASAHLYPEGSASDGPASLSKGDIKFSKAFSVIEGEVVDPDGQPIFGAAITAVDTDGNNIAVTFSGAVDLITLDDMDIPTGGGPGGGQFKLAVPNNATYELFVEPVDGSPVPPGSISGGAVVAAVTGINDYPEEFLDIKEASREPFPESRVQITPVPSTRPITTTPNGSPIRFVTNVENVVENIIRDPLGLENARFDAQVSSFAFADTGIIRYIEKFRRDDLLSVIEEGETLVGFNVATGTFNPSDAPVFTSLKIMTGTVDPDTNEVVLLRTLLTERNFAGQVDDDTPFNFARPAIMTRRIAGLLNRNPNLDIFIVIETDIDNTPRDFEGFPAPFVGTYLPSLGFESPTSFLQLPEGEILSVEEALIDEFPIQLNWAINFRSVSKTKADILRYKKSKKR